MLHQFLASHRAELIGRHSEKVSKRFGRSASAEQLNAGIPMFIDQLIRALKDEQSRKNVTDFQEIADPTGGDTSNFSEMGLNAAAHGKTLFELGYSLEQLVHDYGDLCQSITDLAFELDVPFGIDEFRTLNGCLDNAIADAATQFSAQRDGFIMAQKSLHENEQIGFLLHELRNALSTAVLAVQALEASNLPIKGAVGTVLKRSHESMTQLISSALTEVAAKGKTPEPQRLVSLAAFIADAKLAADLEAAAQNCVFTVAEVNPGLGIEVNYELMLGALMNLLHNAFKFTRPHTAVTLAAYAAGQHIRIDVSDHCGGLPPGNAEKMFTPFTQRSTDKSGMGLGLSIARKSVEADGGTLSVRNIEGKGCVFTIELPRYSLQ